jgi:hypothetical protein
MLKWEREGSGYDIVYRCYSANGLLMAEVFRSGHMYYPWAWYLQDDSKRRGNCTTMRDAKDSAERAIMASLSNAN